MNNICIQPIFTGFSRIIYQRLSPGPGKLEFDTSVKGNFNTGHDYGMRLNDDERRNVLEYLKKI